MNETPGNSFDTTTLEGRRAQIETLLGTKYNTDGHKERFLDGQWAGLEGQTPRGLVDESEEGFNRVKDILRGLKPGMSPEVFIRTDEPKLGQ